MSAKGSEEAKISSDLDIAKHVLDSGVGRGGEVPGLKKVVTITEGNRTIGGSLVDHLDAKHKAAESLEGLVGKGITYPINGRGTVVDSKD